MNPWYQASKGKPRRLVTVVRPIWQGDDGKIYPAPYWHAFGGRDQAVIYEVPDGRTHCIKRSTWERWVKTARIVEGKA